MIIGAGLAGLIAAHAWPKMPVIERGPEPREVHKALLRFRSPIVGELVGIPFTPVTVRKGIWDDGQWVAPNISAANRYSMKTIGLLDDRSIWNISSETRWVAPEDFYERLIDAVWMRIRWGEEWGFEEKGRAVISTAPLPFTLEKIRTESGEQFNRAPITVLRYRIPKAKVYQTTYFPSPRHSLYRASITGDLMICEFADEVRGEWKEEVGEAFGLHIAELQQESREAQQHFGKIAPINNDMRKALISHLTLTHNIYSLGRFATWRNILLDDVVGDITIVRKLMGASSYEKRLMGA